MERAPKADQQQRVAPASQAVVRRTSAVPDEASGPSTDSMIGDVLAAKAPVAAGATRIRRKAGGETPAAANRTGMPDALRAGIETLSGMSMDDVKVHLGPKTVSQLEALAYAQGNDIHVGPGQEQTMAHEAWHVVQQ